VRVVPITDQVARYMSAMDIVVLPTLREGFPVVLLEAGAMALPRIASRVTGCVDAIRDGFDGTLVAARDSGALASAVLRYADDVVLRAAHGARARERIRADFSEAQVVAAQLERYAALLDRSSRSGSAA
jgi:glycosyltransferase involved in cell wall biosynthesis